MTDARVWRCNLVRVIRYYGVILRLGRASVGADA